MKLFSIQFLLLFTITVNGRYKFPGKEWREYTSPKECGFDNDKLERAKKQFDSLGAAAALIVYKGNILASWGETARRFPVASVRKGFLNALLGLAVNNKQIDLNSTLLDLGIDDIMTLTKEEKTATVENLLTARSGIYADAAYEGAGWKNRRPQRGSTKPGVQWFYNNWDFNALGSIYEQATKSSIFNSFKSQIADPLQMQDFRLLDGTYLLEKEKSKYPAYLFKLTARDMARVGLLYLNDGKWKNKKVIPAKWIESSFKKYTDFGVENKYGFNKEAGYGYLWWVNKIQGHDVFYAHGAGTQGIYLVPDHDLVFVFRSDMYNRNRQVNDPLDLELLKSIIDAKTKKAIKSPKLKIKAWYHSDIDKIDTNNIINVENSLFRKFSNNQIGVIEIIQDQKQMILKTRIASFNVFRKNNGDYWIEDINIPASFISSGSGEKQGKAEFEFNGSGDISKLIFYY